MVSARFAPTSSTRVGPAEVGERERQPAVDAEGAHRRRPPPRTCRTGRCSRCAGCAAPTRANLPSAYAFSLVSPPPPKTATASRPCSSWTRAMPVDDRGRARRPSSPGAARRRRVADQRGGQPVAGGRAVRRRSSPSGTARPGWSGSRAGRTVDPAVGPSRSVMPHCRAQYGQCVAASRGGGPGRVADACTVCHVRQSVPPGGFRSGSLLFRSCQERLTPHGGSGRSVGL